MIPDPTDEIRAIKRKLSDACGNDIQRIFEEARRHQQASGSMSAPAPLLSQGMPVSPEPAVAPERRNNRF